MSNEQFVGVDISLMTAPTTAPATAKVDLMFDKFGNPTAGLIIVGKNSDEYRNENHAIRVEGHMRSANRESAIDTKTSEGAGMLVDLVDANQKRIALAVAVDWYGFTANGAPAPFDKATIAAGFNKFPTWVERVSAKLENDASFLTV